MRPARVFATALGIAATAGAGLAGAVEGGVEDRITSHAVAVVTGGPASPSLRCSGTLVAPNVVLSVRHCLAPASSEHPRCDEELPTPQGTPSDLWVSASPWTSASSSFRQVARWVVPETAAVCGDDVALLVLERPFEPRDATPARLAVSEADVRAALLTRAFGLAGFGAASPDGEGAGVRRSRFDVPVRCVPGEPGFECGRALEYVGVREFTGGAGPCAGDSGAGAVARDDRSLVFGVLSRGDLAGSSCAEGVFERTDAWAWLAAKTVLEATPEGQAPPAWVRAVLPDRPGLGEGCRSGAECGAGADCVSLDGRRSFVCAALCDGSGCAEGTRCESGICAPGDAPSRRGEGCAAAGGSAPAWLAGVGGLAWVVAQRRRRA